MQLAANTKLVQNRSRLGWFAFWISLGIMGVSWVNTLGLSSESEPSLSIWLWLMVGMFFLIVARTQIDRWALRARQHTRVFKSLKGLDDRFKVYASLSTRLPDYVVVGPAGVQVVVARDQGGQFACQEGRWRKKGQNLLTAFFSNPFGNPTAEAQVQLKEVRAILEAEGLEDVPASSIVVFTHPNVRLELEGCAITVTKLDELRNVLRRAAGKGASVALNSSRARQVQAVFDKRLRDANTWR